MLSSYAAQAAAWEASQQQQQQQQPIIKEQNVHEILADQYEQLIKKYAKYESYRISIRDDNNEWTTKTFRHHKITSVDYEKAKSILESPDEYSEPIDDDEDEEIEDSTDDFELVIQHYKFLASCYLHMSSEQFENCDWGKTRLVLDACNYRTVHTLVGSEGIYEFFHLDNAKGEPVTSQLTKRGHDYLEMYRLWKTLKITPWRKKGTMYEEDINILLRVDEQFNSGQKHKQKKESAHANRGGENGGMRGPDGVLHKRKTTYKNR